MYIHSKPVPHRTHKKSRNGCLACKIRRVKCDEQKPVCGKCKIHFSNLKACDYASRPEKKKKSQLNPPVSAILLPKHKPANSHFTPWPPQISSPASQPTKATPVPKVSKFPKNEAVSISCQSIQEQNRLSSSDSCGCPCHHPEYTHWLLDAIFGICRICGNLPLLAASSRTCTPVMSDAVLLAGSVDPFSVMPGASSPRVHALMHHWVNTLALYPTEIHSQYCTNANWLSAAIANPSLFNVTLYASALHDAGLHGQRETPESLYYKTETIRGLNQAMADPSVAVADETIATVLLLTHTVSILGEPLEVETHIKGFQQMINLRGGIQNYALDGVLLHMMCTTNHLTAVFSESVCLHPPVPPYTPFKPSLECTGVVQDSPLLKGFAMTAGFHRIMVDLLHDMGYLYAVLDIFTQRFLPECRGGFEELLENIEMGASA